MKLSRYILALVSALVLVSSCGKEKTPTVNPGSNPSADIVIPDRKGMNVKGCVTDSKTGQGISGIVVSDGVQCVRTEADGIFYMNTDLDATRSVFVVVPSDYEVPFSTKMLFNAYKPLSRRASKDTYIFKFQLTPRSSSADNYTMLFLGDPQVWSKRPHSQDSWSYVTTKLKEYKPSVSGDLYQVLLGDMVTNEIEVDGMADSFISTLSSSRINTFTVIGNHDHVQSAVTYYDSVSGYSQYFGPYNYSFNIGKIHYIFFDSVVWSNKDYEKGLTEEAWKFLTADLEYVPKDSPIMICTHCPLTRKQGGEYPPTTIVHYKDMMDALSGRNVVFWYGHVHYNSFWSYSEDQIAAKAAGLLSLDSNVVGRCGGCWACSGEICRDGSPRGMVVMSVNGKDVQWRYKSIDENYPDDFNVILPGQFKGEGLVDDNALYCNVYMWDERWAVPELWVDGKKFGDFTHCVSKNYQAVADPLYSHLFPIWKDQNIKGFKADDAPEDYDNSHLFKITPPTGAGSVEIRIRDRWGNNYNRNIKL